MKILDDYLMSDGGRNFLSKFLLDNREVKFYTDSDIMQGTYVTLLSGESLEDGIYQVVNEGRFLIEESKVAMRFIDNVNRIHLDYGGTMEIETYNKIRVGLRVWIDGQSAKDGEYRLSWLKKIEARKGKIYRIWFSIF